MKFHHIGVVADSIRTGINYFETSLPKMSTSIAIKDPELAVEVCFLEDSSGLRFEIIAPLTSESPIMNALGKRQNILNHLAYSDSDFEEKLVALRRNGHIPLGPPKPAVAFDGSRVVFLLSPLGFILELIEEVGQL